MFICSWELLIGEGKTDNLGEMRFKDSSIVFLSYVKKFSLFLGSLIRFDNPYN